MRESIAEIDIFDSDCTHDVEHGGTSLQRGHGNGRYVSILNSCIATGEDAFAETYRFICPND